MRREPIMPKKTNKLQRTAERYRQIDFNKNEEFQSIVSFASQICETPVALITILDDENNWFVVKTGVDVTHMPRSTSFCQHTIKQESLLEIHDTLLDDRFIENPLVKDPGVRFYAGCALNSKEGNKLGSLCVIDVQPKKLTLTQQRTLEMLSKQVSYLLELELNQILLNEKIERIELQNALLNQIAHIQSHEFRRPVASILGLMNIIKDENYVNARDYLIMMEEAVTELDEKIHLVVRSSESLNIYPR